MNATLRIRLVPMILVAAVLLHGGCASTGEQVSVESLSRVSPQAESTCSYRLINRNRTLDESSLRYKEAVGHVRTALSGHGMFEAPAGGAPDVIVEIDYGIGQPRMRYTTVTEPVYAVVGGPVIMARPAPIASAAAAAPGANPVAEPPQLQLVGYREIQRPVAVRDKYLSVSARPNREAVEGRPAEELWRVSAAIETDNQDLRRYLPVLASIVMEQIGHTTEGTVVAKVSDRSAATDFIRKGM